MEVDCDIGNAKQDEAANAASHEAGGHALQTPSYADQSYWDARYEKEHVLNNFEWYGDFASLAAPLCDTEGPLGECALQPPALVLEIGCGDSALAMRLATQGFVVVAVDFSAPALWRLRSIHSQHDGASSVEARCDLLLGDVRRLPFASGSFDVVLDKGCFDALRHHDSEDMLAEVCRMLREGGRFLCLSNNESLLRSHARKIENWAKFLRAPALVQTEDDEVYLHCYRRLSAAEQRP
mmetsp:Transcript_56014/g.103642  ORF Transcript_56014/g.103642 Transcript_56014/m.103642 type:complete len:238 (+) Transcript_56014:49-762(+)